MRIKGAVNAGFTRAYPEASLEYFLCYTWNTGVTPSLTNCRRWEMGTDKKKIGYVIWTAGKQNIKLQLQNVC
jgi:hypothetical protein